MSQITYTKVDKEDLASTIDAITPVVLDKDPTTVAMACIAIAVLLYKQDIDIHGLMDMVRTTSHFISTTLYGPDTGTIN